MQAPALPMYYSHLATDRDDGPRANGVQGPANGHVYGPHLPTQYTGPRGYNAAVTKPQQSGHHGETDLNS